MYVHGLTVTVVRFESVRNGSRDTQAEIHRYGSSMFASIYDYDLLSNIYMSIRSGGLYLYFDSVLNHINKYCQNSLSSEVCSKALTRATGRTGGGRREGEGSLRMH